MSNSDSKLGAGAPDAMSQTEALVEQSPSTETAKRRSTDRRPSAVASWAMFIALIGLVASIAVGWWSIERSRKIEAATAEKIFAIDARNKELKEQLKISVDAQREQAARQSLIEAKLSEALTQQSQLEKQYQELARSRGELQLSDVEASILAASQQLQWSGNIRSALLALQDADSRLERLNQPPLLGVRRALARDVEKLKQMQTVDPLLLAAKVDLIIEGIPSWRLLSEPKGTSAPSQSANKVSEPLPFFERMSNASARGWSALKVEIMQLFRVQKVDSAEALLLSPEQSFFVRENLRLRLSTLRLALLSRNESMAKQESLAASSILQTYFDSAQVGITTAQNNLRELQNAKIAVDLPSLIDTLNQVRALRVRDSRP
jgi:uroporphyrin-III C-methyltransferase